MSHYVVLGVRAIDFLVLKFNISGGQDAHSTDESGGLFTCLTVDKFMETVDKIFSHADSQAVFAVFASDKFTMNYVKKTDWRRWNSYKISG